jgi:hypothetical protein
MTKPNQTRIPEANFIDWQLSAGALFRVISHTTVNVAALQLTDFYLNLPSVVMDYFSDKLSPRKD